MSLGLTNTKIGVGSPSPGAYISKKHKVAPSVAEQAIFIPKPHKRVSFKLTTGGGDGGAVPLPGSGKMVKPDVTGDNISRANLGKNGLTARFSSAAWQGAPGGYVKMEVDLTPEKQRQVIATQEEGRQVNHKEIYFTQQYDSYGRPRIGFSREPYDFAATKFVSITSQIAFEQNVSKTREGFDKYLLNSDAGKEKPKVQFLGESSDSSTPEVDFLGSDSKSQEPKVEFLGNKYGETSKGKTEFLGDKTDRQTSDAVQAQEDIFLGDKTHSAIGQTDHVTAKDSYESQKVKVVDVFNTKGDTSGPVDTRDSDVKKEVKSIDVTA